MKQYTARILSNKQVAASMFVIDLQCDIDPAKPGQFITVRVASSVVPLLRRPFALSRIDRERRSVSFIYQVRGAGTELLSTYGCGVEVDIIGPLGKPFPLPAREHFSLLVAGGIGLGPVLFLEEMLRGKGYESALVFGCRSTSYIPGSLFESRSVTVCTDDGSSGFSGNVVTYLESIADGLPETTRIYCCGPEPMLKGCHDFALRYNFPCHVSVEQVMACGVGACMGCAVRLADGTSYARACREGPVFDSKDLAWD